MGQSLRNLQLINLISRSAVISFDLFDTLFLRKVHIPTDVFSEIEDFTSSPGFATERIAAEGRVRQSAKDSFEEEVTIVDIYAEIADSYKYLIEIEMEFEFQNIIPNYDMLEVLHFCNQIGKQIYYLSDMYLPEDLIRRMLEKIAAPTPTALYLSSSLMKSKASGSSYRYLMSKSGVSPERILHIGDNEYTDVVIPQSIGINTFHYQKPSESIVERISSLSRGAELDFAFGNLVGSKCIASLASFLSYEKNEKSDFEIVNVALFGPLIVAFLQEIRRRLSTHGGEFDEVLFLGRDMWIIHDIVMSSDYFNPKEKAMFKYVQASRRSWTVHQNPDTFIFEIFREVKCVSLAQIFALMEIPIQNQLEIQDQFGWKIDQLFDENGARAVLDKANFAAIQRLKDNEVYAFMNSSGLLSNKRTLVADIGWTGSLLNRINRFRGLSDLIPLNGLFLFSFPELIREKRLGKIDGLILNNGEPAGLYQLLQSKIDWVEFIFSAPYGQLESILITGNYALPINSLMGESEWFKDELVETSRVSIQRYVQHCLTHDYFELINCEDFAMFFWEIFEIFDMDYFLELSNGHDSPGGGAFMLLQNSQIPNAMKRSKSLFTLQSLISVIQKSVFSLKHHGLTSTIHRIYFFIRRRI